MVSSSVQCEQMETRLATGDTSLGLENRRPWVRLLVLGLSKLILHYTTRSNTERLYYSYQLTSISKFLKKTRRIFVPKVQESIYDDLLERALVTATRLFGTWTPTRGVRLWFRYL